jgi:hypothetical protein
MLETAAIQAALSARPRVISLGRTAKKYLHPRVNISVPCGPRSSGRASRAELLCQIILISIIMHSEPRKSWKRLRVSRRARKSANTSIAPRSTPHWTKRRGAKGKVKVQVTSAEAPVAVSRATSAVLLHPPLQPPDWMRVPANNASSAAPCSPAGRTSLLNWVLRNNLSRGALRHDRLATLVEHRNPPTLIVAGKNNLLLPVEDVERSSCSSGQSRLLHRHQSIDRSLQDVRRGEVVDPLCPFGAAHVLFDHRAFDRNGAPAFVPEEDG